MQQTTRKHFGIDTYQFVFWMFVVLGLAFIASSYPMMKLRFDIWEHVDKIKTLVLNPSAGIGARRSWYVIWAYIFRAFNITDILTIALVIHRVQYVIDCILVYFAAKQIFGALLPLNGQIKEENQWLSSLALASTFVWLTIIGTFSFFQQAWIMWYSVNYQITLPMLFLSLGLLLNGLSVDQSKKQLIVKFISAFGLLLGVYLFHAGELAYFAIYICIFVACFATKYKYNFKYILLAGAFFCALLYIAISFYADHIPALITLLKNKEFGKIITEINAKGTWNAIDGGNRYSANWNELYRLSVYLFFAAGAYAWFVIPKVNKRVLGFILLSLVFCFIPTYKYSSGLASLISYDGIVNRYYYASLVFLAIPFVMYLSLQKIEFIKNPSILLGLILMMLMAVFIYSKYINNGGTYYKNVKSIAGSVSDKKINIEVSDADIADIGTQILDAEKKLKLDEFVYCGSFGDLYIARYFYDKRNLLFDRLGNYSVLDCEAFARDFGKKIIYLKH